MKTESRVYPDFLAQADLFTVADFLSISRIHQIFHSRKYISERGSNTNGSSELLAEMNSLGSGINILDPV